MAAGLFEHAFAGVDQQQRQVGGRGAGDHVARVLDVAGRVGDHELALRRREVAVGDVDRDPLLALGPQAVGEQRQVGLLVAALLRGPLDRLELVFEDRFGVVAAAGRSGSTCRRRPSPRWRSAAAPTPLEVALPLAVLHRRFGEAVVAAGRAALGDPGDRGLLDHRLVVGRARRRRRRCRSRRRRSGSGPSRARPRRPPGSGEVLVDGHQQAFVVDHLALVGEVDRRQVDLLARRGSARRRARSSRRSGRRGCARPCGGGRCRGATARGAGSSDPTGRTCRGRRRPAPWRGPSPRRGGRRRRRRRSRRP